MMYLLLLVGFFFLVKGADVFVDGASSVAKILKIPSVVIGLTIVAMGTSAPEAAVSLTASLSGNNEISLGNIIGSNLFNLLVVIGVCAVIFPVATNLEILKRDMVWNIVSSAALFALILDGRISRTEGALLLTGMAVYLLLLIRNALKNRLEGEEEVPMSVFKSLIFIGLGLAAVVLGGRMVVDNASLIASAWGMSDTLIGLTIVAIGTSLPELVTSVVASRKGDSGIAIGNAVGSCLFNILFILGMTSAIIPIAASPELMIDIGILTAVTILMFIVSRSKMQTSRLEGAVCVLGYIAYSAYIIMR